MQRRDDLQQRYAELLDQDGDAAWRGLLADLDRVYAGSPPPAPLRAALRASLHGQAPPRAQAGPATLPARGNRSANRDGRQRPPWSSHLPAVVLALCTLTCVVAATRLLATMSGSTRSAGHAGVAHPPRQARLYLLDSRALGSLWRLDPATLAGVRGGPALTLAGLVSTHGQPWLLPSPDGTVLAAVTYLDGNVGTETSGNQIVVQIFDAATGRQRARFHPPVPLIADALSSQGTQIMGEGQASDVQRIWPVAWYALDAGTGRLLSTIRYVDPLAVAANRTAVGDQRLYTLDTYYIDARTGQARAPVLRSYDRASGRQVGALTLRGVLAGSSGHIKINVGGHDVYAEWQPGFALSPDGQRLAVLDGSTNALRLIDTRTLKIVRTVSLTRPQSLLDRVGDLLGVVPQVALAKGGAGTVLDLHFSPDGGRLYVTGYEGQVARDGSISYRDLGLQVVDVARGAFVASAPQGWLGLSADGRDLYTLTGDAAGERWTLRRDDPVTLQARAQRTFAAFPWLFLLGRAAG